MTPTELERQRKDLTNQVRKKSAEKIKRMKMSRALPLTLPQICLHMWDDTRATSLPESAEAVPTGGTSPLPSSPHQTRP